MTRPELLSGFVDDAGLFPPTALDMTSAVRRHRADRLAGEPMLTHRFLCPASRIGELRSELSDSDRIRVGLIVDRGTDGLNEVLKEVENDERLSPALLEIPLAAFSDSYGPASLAALRAIAPVSSDVPAFFEPADPSRIDSLADELATADEPRGLGAKLRCGGVRAELFPGPERVADFLVTCARAEIPLKATAGLHEAVRHRDPATGFVHHGYLNLLAAAASAAQGADADTVREPLLIEDPTELTRRVAELDAATARRARGLLVSYGSCSTDTPVRQARELLGSTER